MGLFSLEVSDSGSVRDAESGFRVRFVLRVVDGGGAGENVLVIVTRSTSNMWKLIKAKSRRTKYDLGSARKHVSTFCPEEGEKDLQIGRGGEYLEIAFSCPASYFAGVGSLGYMGKRTKHRWSDIDFVGRFVSQRGINTIQ